MVAVATPTGILTVLVAVHPIPSVTTSWYTTVPPGVIEVVVNVGLAIPVLDNIAVVALVPPAALSVQTLV